ncbi:MULTISPECIES: succinylglutamate desuccinylase/aspartoacylase family protein [unclassified Fusibacter]|uniref:M99 family carboxypeptidase catalytic domain-containing protein n=1 Tax=unclassified Fusibacter TaxID=2624464 RepID=UPI0013E91C8A|nr:MULTISPECIES: succinylglutamate desuccinylase/aspartoacylase family protein [unclassified Fusibacter]MCK8061069.1 succinylglutamate desuccinylase/aspartoacylase family protein [Fusibacter sp. A2]NPE20477.1 hypothetical protein [Fusibacter sp. A1]
MIVAGIHGDEVAGIRAAEVLSDMRLKDGSLIVIPVVNQPAVLLNQRTAFGQGDLNRLFSDNTVRNPVVDEVIQMMVEFDVDLVIDLHEALPSIGNADQIEDSIIVGKYGASLLDVVTLFDRVGSKVTQVKGFTYLNNPVSGSLNQYASDMLKIPAYTIETNRLDQLDLRVLEHVELSKALIDMSE